MAHEPRGEEANKEINFNSQLQQRATITEKKTQPTRLRRSKVEEADGNMAKTDTLFGAYSVRGRSAFSPRSHTPRPSRSTTRSARGVVTFQLLLPAPSSYFKLPATNNYARFRHVEFGTKAAGHDYANRALFNSRAHAYAPHLGPTSARHRVVIRADLCNQMVISSCCQFVSL